MGADPIDPLGVPTPTGVPLGILGPGGTAGVADALVMLVPGGIAGVNGALGIGYPDEYPGVPYEAVSGWVTVGAASGVAGGALGGAGGSDRLTPVKDCAIAFNP